MNSQTKFPSYAEGLEELRNNLGNMLPEAALQVFDTDAENLAKTHTNILKLHEGGKAVDFSLVNAVGNMVSLSKTLEKQRVVLTFYRGTWCPYCNLQLNQYQQILPEIKEMGATLIAISPQTPDESLNISEKNALQFEVLSDNGNIVAKKYTTVFTNGNKPIDTMTNLGFNFDAHYADDSRELPVPAVFIIEKDGTISFAKAINGDYRNRVEASEILNALKK